RVDEEDLARAAAACDATYLISCFGFPMPYPPAGARVIEDAAHGLFSRDAAGRPLGARADAAVFCPRKSLGTPDGGAVLLRQEGRRIDAVAGRPERRAMVRSFASLVAGRAAIAAPRLILVRERFAELERARHGLLALPVHHAMQDRHVELVMRAAKAVFHAAARPAI